MQDLSFESTCYTCCMQRKPDSRERNTAACQTKPAREWPLANPDLPNPHTSQMQRRGGDKETERVKSRTC